MRSFSSLYKALEKPVMFSLCTSAAILALSGGAVNATATFYQNPSTKSQLYVVQINPTEALERGKSARASTASSDITTGDTIDRLGAGASTVESSSVDITDVNPISRFVSALYTSLLDETVIITASYTGSDAASQPGPTSELSTVISTDSLTADMLPDTLFDVGGQTSGALISANDDTFKDRAYDDAVRNLAPGVAPDTP